MNLYRVWLHTISIEVERVLRLSLQEKRLERKNIKAMQRGDDLLGLDVEPISPVSAKDKSSPRMFLRASIP